MNGSADAEPNPMAMETDGSVKSEVETARIRIAKAAGVPQPLFGFQLISAQTRRITNLLRLTDMAPRRNETVCRAE